MRTRTVNVSRPPGARPEPVAVSTEEEPWMPNGIVAGVIGAAVVALFFLVVDVVAAEPFRTPSALGSQLFLGEPLAPKAAPQPVLVLGYTAMHGVVFACAGLMGAFALLGNRRRVGNLTGLALAGGIFAGLEIFFLAFAGLLAPQLISEFGFGMIATANLLAAGAMSASLLRPPLWLAARRSSAPSRPQQSAS